jgi:hypothetical protein
MPDRTHITDVTKAAGKARQRRLAERQPPKNQPATKARTKALAVPSVVAIRNGGLLSSANGVFDMIPNSRAGSET